MIYKTLLVLATIAVTINADSFLGLGYPLGVPAQNASGLIRSMSGTGTGLRDNFAGFSANPANMAMPNYSSISAVFSMNYFAFRSETTDYSNSTSPSLLSFIMPLGQLGNAGISIDKRTEGSVSFRSARSLSDGNGSGGDSVYTGLVRDGGLTSWQGGWGYLFDNGLSIGLSYQHLYHEMTTDQIYGYISDSRGAHSNVVQGSSVGFPAKGISAGVLFPVSNLTVGFTGEYILPSEGTVTTRDILLDTIVRTKSDISVHLPPSVSFGLSYSFNHQWLAAADLATTLWERYISDFEKGAEYRTTYCASAGIRYTPVSGQISQRYSETIDYRAGVRFSQMPVEGASERALTLGIGLPVQEKSGLVDIVFEMGRHTNDQFKDYYESFYSIHLGINSLNRWFERTTQSTY